MSLVYCVDFGSTFTKGALVDLTGGELLGTASHPTTLDTDVLDGWERVREQLPTRHGAEDVRVLACSSAGGGLRIAVVGNEDLVTAEVGRRVALSSGGRVVVVSAGPVDVGAVAASRPDVLLLVGGTDGGNAEVLVGNAEALCGAGWSGPVVVAGNATAAGEVAARLARAGINYRIAENVLPQIGVFAPASARRAIRDMFVAHVIGGKHLSRRADFTAMVKGATPDVVLTGVELLANGLGPDRPGVGDVVVVDIGGATTDVHSVVEVDPEDASLSREVVGAGPVSRTVEGDLGMRWSAAATVRAAADAGLGLPTGLAAAAERRHRRPAKVPGTPEELEADLQLATAAAVLAVRRHAGRQRIVFGPDGRVVERSGKDLREVALLVGSGGVLRHSDPASVGRVLSAATGGGGAGGWLVPRAPELLVDRDYVLAAAGLLAVDHPLAAYKLLSALSRQKVSALEESDGSTDRK